MKILISIVVIIVVLISSLFVVGTQQPSRKISAYQHVIFVALKHRDKATMPLPQVLQEKALFQSETAFSLVGPDDPYWTAFLLLPPDTIPSANDISDFEDSYIAEIELVNVPVWLLGGLRALHLVGIHRRPTGPLPNSPEELGTRLDVLPSQLALDMAKQMTPSEVTMVNFLEYKSDDSGDKTLGRQSYGRYGLQAIQTVHRVGGQFLFNGKVIKVLKHPTHLQAKEWDDLATMIYPEAKALLSMEQDKGYKSVLEDRDEGLESTLVIATLAK